MKTLGSGTEAQEEEGQQEKAGAEEEDPYEDTEGYTTLKKLRDQCQSNT